MKIRITIEGTTSLLCHNARLANPLDPIVRQMKTISGKRKKTDEDLERLARLEFEGGLYFDSSGPHIPGANIEKCMVEGAKITRQGKQIERGLFITDDEVPLLYNGPRGVEELWENETYRSMMSVKVGQNRVMRCRPMFRAWTLEAEGEMDPAQLNLDAMQQIASDAGSMVGLGDYRPRFGRFVARVEKIS